MACRTYIGHRGVVVAAPNASRTARTPSCTVIGDAGSASSSASASSAGTARARVPTGGAAGTTTGTGPAPSSRASTSMLRPDSRSVTAPAAATFSMKSRKLPAPYSRSENVESSCSSVLFSSPSCGVTSRSDRTFSARVISGSAFATGLVPADRFAPRPDGRLRVPTRFSYAMNS